MYYSIFNINEEEEAQLTFYKDIDAKAFYSDKSILDFYLNSTHYLASNCGEIIKIYKRKEE